MSAATTTNFASWLKTQYPNGYEDMLYKNFPLYSRFKKSTDFEGDYKMLVNRFGSVTGASVTFGTAQKNKSPSQVSRFQLARSKEYVVLSVDGETLKASASQKGAVSAILKAEIDSGMLTFKRRLAQAMYGNGGGSIGTIATSGISTTTITLTNRTDAINFSKGQVCVLSTDDGFSATTGLEAGTITVAGVNRKTGVITFTGNVTAGIATAADADKIFWEGDYAGKIKGLRAWCPDSDPTATAFLGVDRTQDTVKLGGIRVPAGSSIEETLQDAIAELYIEGADPEWCMLNPLDWQRLAKAMGSKVIIDIATDRPGISFKGLEVVSQNGTIAVMGDPFCPKGRSFMSQDDIHELHGLGDIPSILMDDGNRMLRDLTEDAYEVRIGCYLAQGCEAPGYTANIVLP